jgi:hypothetical protein
VATVSAFGPFYPPALQEVVNHAERLADLLVAHELSPPHDEWAQAWLLGRASEVSHYAEHVVASWRAGRLDEAAAAAALDGYLDVVHEGMARHLPHASRGCCQARDATTRPLPPSAGSRTIFDGDPFDAWPDTETKRE